MLAKFQENCILLVIRNDENFSSTQLQQCVTLLLLLTYLARQQDILGVSESLLVCTMLSQAAKINYCKITILL